MTTTMPIVPLMVGLDKALKRIGRTYWVGLTLEQRMFVLLLPEYAPALALYKDLIDGTVAGKASEINEWLAERGFDITLEDWTEEDSFGVAGVSDVQLTWSEPGTESQIFTDDDDLYPSFDMDVKDGVAAVYKDASGRAVVELQTKEGMVARFQMCDDPGISLAEVGLRLHQAKFDEPMLKRGFPYGEVRIPMVSVNQQADLEWLLGLFSPQPGAPDCKIAQAVGQTKLGLNQFGARAKEAAAAQMVFESMSYPFEVNKAFLLTIGYPGAAPLVVIYVTPDDWADPGNLDEL